LNLLVIDFDPRSAFAVFDQQDSGCVSFGVAKGGRRLFVKTAVNESGRESLRRAATFHGSVKHPAIVRPVDVIDTSAETVLVYPWVEGVVLNSATVTGSDRSGLARFQQLPTPDVEAALDVILTAHLAVVAAGFVAVDLYDGCFLYDFDRGAMHLIDLDEYRRGPFTFTEDRLPGSLRYMAPEELRHRATVDERTTVFNLGRTITWLLESPHGWRGAPTQRAVAERATSHEPADRYATVALLVDAWGRCR
jgi:serine/threonine-protein kinase